jgi:hypothetical protein
MPKSEGIAETNAYVECPECGAQYDLTGVDIGGLDLIPLPVHIKGQWPDVCEPHNSMMLAGSRTGLETCPSSELLVWVKRPEEDM